MGPQSELAMSGLRSPAFAVPGARRSPWHGYKYNDGRHCICIHFGCTLDWKGEKKTMIMTAAALGLDSIDRSPPLRAPPRRVRRRSGSRWLELI